MALFKKTELTTSEINLIASLLAYMEKVDYILLYLKGGMTKASNLDTNLSRISIFKKKFLL